MKSIKTVIFTATGKPLTTLKVRGYNKALNPPKAKISTSTKWED